MIPFSPLRNKPTPSPLKKGDLLVLFGELFNRGYANGLTEEAEKRGMTIVRATVGRRDRDLQLRPLNEEETQNIPKPFINIPLEAGFDHEPDSQGITPVDHLKDIKLSDWENFQLSPQRWEESRQRGQTRFKKSVVEFMGEIEKLWKPGQNIVFAHLMAGGVPRAKIVMPLMNRSFKGTGDRYLSSEKFWNSSIGRLCAMSFEEVTAETFRYLLELSTPLREKVQNAGGHVSYTAYGYHGTEVIVEDQYQWQTYTPYLQGWAKIKLEEISAEYFKKSVHCCVYNCPEILTNSSSIFQGVEVSLYPLLQAIEKEAPHSEKARKILSDCKSLLKDEFDFSAIKKHLNDYLTNPLIKQKNVYREWPLHSSQQHLEKMLHSSEELIAMHKDSKQLITFILSEVVFESCGHVMLHDSWAPKNPSAWIGHDLIAKCL